MRLIDADKIEKFIEDGLNCKDPNKRFGHDAIEIMTEVHYAPTVSIETLLAEREAAVEMLKGMCRACKYSDRDSSDYPCCHCFKRGGMSDNWEWASPTPPDRQQAEKE